MSVGTIPREGAPSLCCKGGQRCCLCYLICYDARQESTHLRRHFRLSPFARNAKDRARIIKGRPFRVGCGWCEKQQPKRNERNTLMNSVRYVGMDVHRDTISVAVLDESGRPMMQSVLATRAAAILDCIHGMRGPLHVTFEEGTHSAWLYDVLVRRVAKLVVCNPRKNALMKSGSKSDAIDARKLAEPALIRGLNWNHNHEMKNLFKSTATAASVREGVWREFYLGLLDKGMRPEMARLTLARKIAAITLKIWKKGETFDAEHLKLQAA